MPCVSIFRKNPHFLYRHNPCQKNKHAYLKYYLRYFSMICTPRMGNSKKEDKKRCKTATSQKGAACISATLFFFMGMHIVKRWSNIKLFHFAEKRGFVDFQFFGGSEAVPLILGQS